MRKTIKKSIQTGCPLFYYFFWRREILRDLDISVDDSSQTECQEVNFIHGQRGYAYSNYQKSVKQTEFQRQKYVLVYFRAVNFN